MFVFGVGTIDKGAAVSVLSQFPDEEVCLFSCLCSDCLFACAYIHVCVCVCVCVCVYSDNLCRYIRMYTDICICIGNPHPTIELDRGERRPQPGANG